VTILEIELAVCLIVFVGSQIWLVRKVLDGVYDRQKALDSYVKAVTRDKLVVLREAQKAVEQAQQTRAEALHVLERVEGHMNDPELRRLLGRG
jgi:hypothetical protein